MKGFMSLVIFCLLGLVLVFPARVWALEVPAGTRKVIFYDASGKPLKALEDEDGDGFFETTYFFKQGRLSKKIKFDRARRPEEILEFDSSGALRRLLLDRNKDGKIDKWQSYRKGQLVLVEEDRNFDGQIDLRAWMKASRPQRIERDDDHDGRFEVEESWGPEGKRILLKDFDQNHPRGQVYARIFYRKDQIYQRLLDLDRDGFFEIEELYREGKRCLVLKKGPKPEAFLYQNGRLRRGFRDLDGDGKFEEEYDYARKVWQKLTPVVSLKDLKEKCR